MVGVSSTRGGVAVLFMVDTDSCGVTSLCVIAAAAVAALLEVRASSGFVLSCQIIVPILLKTGLPHVTRHHVQHIG